MADDATQPGVSEDKGTPERNSSNSYREQLAEAISKQREQELIKEAPAQAQQEPAQAEIDATEDVGEADPEDATQEQPEADEPTEELMTIKVDGVEMQVAKGKVVEAGTRAIQKESAADKRLEEATRRLREVETREAALKQAQQQLEEKKIDPAKIAETLNYGTDEERVKAVEQLLSAVGRKEATQPPDVNAIVEKAVAERLAFDEFSKPKESGGYGDLLADPYANLLLRQKEHEKRSAGDTRADLEVWKECGNEVRAWLGKHAPPPASPTPPKGGDDFAAKRQKKQGMDTATPAIAAAPPQSAAPKPQTQQEIVDEMRKKRGQR